MAHRIKLNGTTVPSFQVGLRGATISSEAVTSPYSLVLPPAIGTSGQALILDSNANLVFGNVSSGGSVTNVPYIAWIANSGQTLFTNTNLAQYPSGTPLTVFRNGVLMRPEEYSVSGNTLTISTYLVAEDEIEIPSRGITSVGNIEYANTSGVAYSVAGSNVVGAVANATFATTSGSATNSTTANTANSVAGANVTGTVANATFATTAGTANSVAAANITGTINFATNSTTANTANSVAGANVTGTVANATFATTAGTANSVAGANVTGTVANATFATTSGSATTASTANSVAAANITGTINFATNSTNANVANIANTATNANFANFAGNVTLAAQANITSVGALSSLVVNGNINANGFVLLKAFTETTANASSSSTFAPDLANGTIQRFTATSNFTFNGFTNPVIGQNGVFVITQDATGGRLMTTTMKFVGGSKTLSTAPNSVDVIGVFYDGITYYASLTKDYK